MTCGRIKSDFRYSNTIVYNNFPWPTPTAEQRARIEQTAQAILDDRAVMAAYGFTPGKTTESDCVAKLFEMYQELIVPKAAKN